MAYIDSAEQFLPNETDICVVICQTSLEEKKKTESLNIKEIEKKS